MRGLCVLPFPFLFLFHSLFCLLSLRLLLRQRGDDLACCVLQIIEVGVSGYLPVITGYSEELGSAPGGTTRQVVQVQVREPLRTG